MASSGFASRAAASASSVEIDAVSLIRPNQPFAQPEQLAQPVERSELELRRGGRRLPQHRVHVERRNQHLGQDAGCRRRDREVGEEPRVVPVRDARHDEPLEVIEHRIERLGLGRRLVRNRRRDLARGDARDDGKPLGMLQVVADPLENAARLTTELVRRDVAKRRCVGVNGVSPLVISVGMQR